MSMSTTLRLNCLTLGEERYRIFPVDIPGTETVGALREAKKKPAFDHVAAESPIPSFFGGFPSPTVAVSN
jgi:hypothetical protein